MMMVVMVMLMMNRSAVKGLAENRYEVTTLITKTLGTTSSNNQS